MIYKIYSTRPEGRVVVDDDLMFDEIYRLFGATADITGEGCQILVK